MDTLTPNVGHVLSGRNPTLFSVVAQYADMDMLRALALTSCSAYKTLQKCQFAYLSMVVLETSVLKGQRQVVYDGADPVPGHTLSLTMKDIATPPSQTEESIRSYGSALKTWERRCSSFLGFEHNLNIPDYARNFMARTQSVELVVYRRRLGTTVSTIFTDNAHRFKHGESTDVDECTSCDKSNSLEQSTSSTSQYKLHLPSLTTPRTSHHCADVEHGSDGSTHLQSDDDCAFSKYPSHQYPNGDAIERSRLAHVLPYSTAYDKNFPLDSDPSFLIKVARDNPQVVMTKVATLGLLLLALVCFVCGNTGIAVVLTPIYAFSIQIPFLQAFWRDIIYTRATYYINPSRHDTRLYHPRFQNLPLIGQQAPTTSLKIRIVDCLSFGVEDWCNAIPGCTIQPLQTCFVRDRTSGDDDNYRKINTADHFPHLTSLVLQHTRLDETNRCGIGGFNMDVGSGTNTPIAHFFIDCDIRLPHLQHFGVIGTLLYPEKYASIVFHNAHITSLNINPGLQPIDDAHILAWMTQLNDTLDELEHDHAKTSSITANNNDLSDHEAAYLTEDNDEQRHVEYKHKLHPQRKYNFSIDIADPCVDNCCPNKTHVLTQRALTNSSGDSGGDAYQDFTQVGQHYATCGLIYNALSKLYLDDMDGCETTYNLSISSSLTLSLPFAGPVSWGALRPVATIARLAQRTLTCLEMRCHYCSYANTGSTPFPGASPGDCTATHLPPYVNVPLCVDDLTQDDEEALARAHSTQRGEQMYMRLRELLHIPPHVVLRL